MMSKMLLNFTKKLNKSKSNFVKIALHESTFSIIYLQNFRPFHVIATPTDIQKIVPSFITY